LSFAPLDRKQARLQNNNVKIAGLAASIFALDQITKFAVLKYIPADSSIDVLPGFFRLVHWQNTGAAWSMFSGNNMLLAAISAVALVVLIITRKRFGSETLLGWIALGLLFGGILGNLLDRVLPSRNHVIDFLYFHLITRTGREIGFPAFNVADSAICVGVGLMFILSWRSDKTSAPAGQQT
jgi:signal peptidase II